MSNSYRLEQVAIRMVKMPPLISNEPIINPEAAIRVMNDTLKEFDREALVVVNLQNDLKPINMNFVSLGTLNSSVAHPREILKTSINAIKNAAKGLIPGISREDILNLILPVPSLNYQAKVVERVVEMTNILSSIEKSLS